MLSTFKVLPPSTLNFLQGRFPFHCLTLMMHRAHTWHCADAGFAAVPLTPQHFPGSAEWKHLGYHPTTQQSEHIKGT